jgi:hypothetical protein
MERSHQAGQPAAIPAPTLEQVAAAQAQLQALRDELTVKAKESIAALINSKRAEAGDAEIERATVAGAITAALQFLGETGRLVPGPFTQNMANVAIDAISKAAVEAKKEAEDKRIILVGA